MISSELIANTATEECTSAVLEMIGVDSPKKGDVSYMVFDTKVDDKQFFCCWSGGEVKDKEVELTAVGVGALEALSRVEAETREGIDVFVLNSSDRDDLINEVKQAFSKIEDRSRVCFVGDVAGTLRNWLPEAFNVKNWQQ
ncbi:hypothetical protein [Echinimonas agarilytica]|uniref:Uncharacterized protein n=1 Tax=Echinimonas agarilytica TaxID=1215918 RepID=A0AA41W407_9GAMM|nr:hypothetical protein [Echinimonas agarilytica]MCM2678421.1 hypothetical protein [Echinimonas agarilytica]